MQSPRRACERAAVFATMSRAFATLRAQTSPSWRSSALHDFRRGCVRAVLFTMAIQAPRFYERHGYEVFGTIECEPPGNARIFMKKELR
jgi:hypothetical protein